MPQFIRNLFFLSIMFLSHYAPAQPLQLVNAFPNLTFTQPLFVTHANDGTNRIFVVQQNGLIRVFPNDSTVTSAATFLNLSSRIITGGERGLLGLAFHPNYATNGYFYVNYTQAGNGRTIVARYRVDPQNPNQGDFNSELILLNIYQPFSNHNGGMIMFGRDGYLYIGMGDGGSAGDPANRAQNLDSLLGKMLRIDVDTVSASTNYGIPPDNPLVGIPGRDEIYAWGLRNPWRFSQDPVTGEIWLADVGQGSWEEVDSIGSGLNYGWRCYEGPAPYNTSLCGPISLYTFPVRYYARVSPHCSVTGGYIYRGSRRPELVGRYIYGDYCSGYIWKLNRQLSADSLLIDAPFFISSFGVDQDGELYVCNYSGGNIQQFAGAPVLARTSQVSPINGSQNVEIPTVLRWTAASGAIAYWLEVTTDPNFLSFVIRDSTLVDTSYVSNALVQGTRYYWRVRAKNTVGWGNFSSIWNFRTIAPPGVITLVEPGCGSNVPSRVVAFRWRSENSATSYWFEMGFDSTFAAVERRDTALTDTSLIVLNATLDTVYYWRVRGRNSAGLGSFSPACRFTTYSLPPQPLLISPIDSAVARPDTLQFLWGSIPAIFNYWFELSTDENFATTVARDTALTDTLKTLFNLDPLTLHYWRVRARNRGGYGPFSEVGVFFTQEILDVGENKFLPQQFALYQNYPNPFNPSTQITYDTPKESHIRLSVSNILGQEVKVLYEGIKQAGRHSLEFNATGFSSGLYFYKLETAEFHAVRKMVLMK